MRTPLLASLLACAVSLLPSATSLAAAPPPAAPKKALPTFQDVDRLANEHQYEEAAKAAAAIRDEAKSLGKDEDWARALLKETQLRLGLHGYETAVKLLKEQPWPPDPSWRAVLDLYYARTLTTYARAYSWEINQRERVDTKGVVDLKAWTRDQIYAEAQRAYQDVWTRREVLGNESVKKLSEFLEANTFPAGVRPTLRDAVSYLRVELLADTLGWRPEQSNEVFELDRAALIQGDPATSAKIALDDPAVHPLLKIGAVLDDLEAWHAKAGRREAVLETRLERASRLHSAFTEPDDKAAVVADLAKRLAGFTDVPWWSWGMATLATFTQQDGKPEAAVRAHALATACSAKFPGSPGAQRCLHLAKSIEAPAYQLAAMAADAPGKRSVTLQHKNLPALYLRAYPYNLEKRIGEARNYNLLPNGEEMAAVLRSQKPAAEWKVELPATPDFEMHRTFSVPPLKQKGAYLLIASARPDFSKTNNQLQGALLAVTDVVLVQRLLPGEAELTALSGATGMPLPGVAVSLYVYNWNSGHRLVETKTTGVEGTVRFKRREDGGSYFTFARRGADVSLDPNYLYFPWEGTPSETTSALVFTDRSVYRPSQKIFWKVVGYKGRSDQARWQTLPKQALTVSLRDANWQTVETKSVVTNEFGSAAGEFLVPAGRMLGRWAVATSLNGEGAVQVEEYKRPTFEVSLKDADGALRLNKEATLKGEARYYFGLPVASGGARWKVVRTPVYPWWWGWWWGYGAAPAAAQTVASGTSKIDPDGSFQLTFVPKADERAGETNKDLSYRYAVSVDVTDEGGETRSAERSFRLGLVSVEAAISTDKGFFAESDATALTITRTDLNGAPRPGKGSFTLFALKQPSKTLLPAEQPLPRPRPGQAKRLQTAGDEVRPRHDPGYSPDALIYDWADGAQKAQGELAHDDKGRASAALGKLPPGAWRLRYQTVDDFGARFETFKDFVVAAPKAPLALPAYFAPESTSVAVGGTARFFVHSGLEQQLLVLDVYQAGKRLEQRLLISGRDSDLVEIPVTEKLRGGFTVQVHAVRDYQAMPLGASVMVPWDDRELKVEFATFRDRIRPGDQETFKVTVSAAAGKLETGSAELLAYMYDRSLDLFAPHSPPSVSSLYPGRAYGPAARANLGPAHLEYLDSGFASLPGFPSFYPDRLKFHDSYGIGGMGRGGGGVGGVRFRQSVRGPEKSDELAAAAPAPQPTPDLAKSAAEPVTGEAAQAFGGLAQATTVPMDGTVAPGQAAPVMRSNFSETAFWKPVLLLNPDGSASFEFTVPDSVTSWKVWVHALTRDLKGGSASRETKSVKDLMVRPYLPRFLRESDEAILKVVVNNASDQPLSGKVTLDLIDPETSKSVLADFGLAGVQPQPFDVKPGGGANVSYTLKAPKRVGQVNVKVVASSGAASDGELRPLPLLPSRMHLMQSKFVTLKNKEKRELSFEDLAKSDDPTRVNEQLVVQLDAQLFYSVLTALPYLVNYPYECTEQTLNRFVSTGIVSSVYKDYPAVARMAEQMGKRDTPLESFEGQDPNRKIALEETPWVIESKGGTDLGFGMVNVLDPRAAKAERETSLAKLRKAQTANGGFPWWPGGPPSPYMTLYLLYGFAKAAEFGVDVPKDMVQRGWAYLASEFRSDYANRMIKDDCCWEFLTFLNYVASCYPDPSWTGDALNARERAQILDFSFRHWKQHSPYLKGLLTLTLKRADRLKDAQLVFASVMDSAKTTRDEGTFWSPEDRGWLWYNDTIESHAFALRTLSELNPKDARRDGLVHWLLLNKKLNHWKSTRATAEVIYSLVHYLKAENQLGVRENAKVTVGPLQHSFVFEPDQYTGKKNQIVIAGEKLDPKTMSKVVVEKDSPGFLFASASWHFSTDLLPKEDKGDLFSVKRTFFKRVTNGKEVVLQPLAEGAQLAPGDEVEIQLSLRSKAPAEYVHLRDPRAAGTEPVSVSSKWRWDLGLAYYEEVRDSATNFFFENLPQGEYTFKYRVRAASGGTFRIGPATVQSMYAPEFGAYSSGYRMSIAPLP
ncbi:MAG: alpha-2-macroglobulin family protein [Myxococcales bacterium]